MAKVLEFKRASNGTPKRVLRKAKPPGRRSNEEIGRKRKHLVPAETKALIAAAGSAGRYRERDRVLLTMMYRHGLRVSELTDMRWDQVDFTGAKLHVTRLKKGNTGTHPIQGDELRALRAHRKASASEFIFVTDRGGPLTRSTVNKLIATAGERAGIPFRVTPHMLRHACGYKLAADRWPTRNIQQWLGHRTLSQTAEYTALADDSMRNVRW